MTLPLPPRTQPPVSPTRRAHSPRPAGGSRGYRSYRPCLRWDFGFTCAFCLVHEADVIVTGTEGWGVFSAEHMEPRSANPALVNDYSNLAWCCRKCNVARRALERIVPSGRLLDPTQDAWGDHFDLVGVTLVPRNGDAERTTRVYQLNSEPKLEIRRFRYEALTQALALLAKPDDTGTHLLERASEDPDPGARLRYLTEAEDFRRGRSEADACLSLFAAIPGDAPRQHPCGALLQLPDWLAAQVEEFAALVEERLGPRP